MDLKGQFTLTVAAFSRPLQKRSGFFLPKRKSTEDSGVYGSPYNWSRVSKLFSNPWSRILVQELLHSAHAKNKTYPTYTAEHKQYFAMKVIISMSYIG